MAQLNTYKQVQQVLRWLFSYTSFDCVYIFGEFCRDRGVAYVCGPPWGSNPPEEYYFG